MEEKISKSIINRMLTGRLQAVNMLAGRLQAVKLLAALLMLTPWLALPQQADAQTTYGQTPRGNREQTKKQKKKEKKPTEVDYPLYNGFSVGMDLWGLGGKVFGSDFVSTEVAVDVDLKHRYFPVAEIGYGSTDQQIFPAGDGLTHVQVALSHFVQDGQPVGVLVRPGQLHAPLAVPFRWQPGGLLS